MSIIFCGQNVDKFGAWRRHGGSVDADAHQSSGGPPVEARARAGKQKGAPYR
jgi:hypothetical protein